MTLLALSTFGRSLALVVTVIAAGLPAELAGPKRKAPKAKASRAKRGKVKYG